mgnify:CR=1 FL=1
MVKAFFCKRTPAITTFFSSVGFAFGDPVFFLLNGHIGAMAWERGIHALRLRNGLFWLNCPFLLWQ